MKTMHGEEEELFHICHVMRHPNQPSQSIKVTGGARGGKEVLRRRRIGEATAAGSAPDDDLTPSLPDPCSVMGR